jgi:hypothetical protein
VKMDSKYIKRRRIAAWAAAILIASLFTYATRDTCYVGEGGNALGYGSCTEMIDQVIEGGK